jgi:glycosyltransferase involved in cell wall biosynthesis
MGLRILLVTRRFWPFCTQVEGWRNQGARVSVVMPQWDRTWPEHVVVREVGVTRLAFSPKRLWGNYWYLRRLYHWLRRNAKDFDVLVVSRLQLDILIATRVGAELKVPVVLLYEEVGADGDAEWIKRSPYSTRIHDACRNASAIFAFNDQGSNELLSLNLPPDRLYQVRSTIPVCERSGQSRSAARMHLLESNRDFFTTSSTPVGLTIASLGDRGALQQLLAAWRQLRETHHDARLWWIGDGSNRSSLYELLGEYELRYHAVLPGDFDDVRDLLQAADFYIAHTTESAGMALQSMATCLPVIAGNTPEIRNCLPAGAPIQFVDSRDTSRFALAMRQACDAPEANWRRGRALGDWMMAQAAPDAAAKEQLGIMELVISERPR